MPQRAGFPYFQVQFDKHGAVFDPDEAKALIDGVETGGITDLIVVSHGWKNDIADATMKLLAGAMQELIVGPPTRRSRSAR